MGREGGEGKDRGRRGMKMGRVRERKLCERERGEMEDEERGKREMNREK